jgi:RND family efflux transporter MFP subunit
VSPAAISAYQQAVTAVTQAGSVRATTTQLLEQKLVTRDQLVQADKALADAQAALEALRREGGANRVEILTAPVDGMVMAVQVAEGDHVAPGTPLITFMRTDGLVVTVGVEPADKPKLHRGAAARLQPLTSGTAPLEGKVLRIDAMLNPKTRLVDADISVPAKAVMLGEYFRADIVIGRIEGWLVPRNCLRTDGDGTYLFQVTDDKAVRVPVRPLGESDDIVVVTGPVDPGRVLVTEGNFQLADGMPVRHGTTTP